MKKILVFLMFVTGLFAISPDSKELPLKMKKLQNNMEEIQRAGLYNCTDCMKHAIMNLKKNIKFAEKIEVKKFLPEHQKYATKFSEQRVKMILMYADDMLESIKNKKLDDALDDYSQILRQCTSCHVRLRNW